MDVIRLDDAYLGDSLVEGYTSMIWTERLLENGEFELKTAEVEATKNLLPEGAHISLLDSYEVMTVETHEISVDSAGNPELTVTGRSFETFLENRVALPTTYQQPWAAIKPYTLSELVSFILWNNLVNATGQDPSRTAWTQDDRTELPHVIVTDSTTITQPSAERWLKEGEMYSQLREFLGLGGLGVRNIRPYHSIANAVSFDTSATSYRGDVLHMLDMDVQDLRLDVYNGLDRRYTQSVNEPVIFHYDSGHIDNPKYLFSSKELKTMATVSMDTGPVNVYPETGLTPPSVIPEGLDRRILFMDGGSQGTMDPADFLASNVQKALIELSKHNRQFLFDGAISAVSPYKYGQEYALGDQVSLIAQYGFESSMIVVEYVRTEDHEGDRGYPTLILSS